MARLDMRAVPYSTSLGVSPSRALTATWVRNIRQNHQLTTKCFEAALWPWTSWCPLDHLGGDSDVGEGDASPRRVPLGDVEKPLGGRAGLEEVAEETSNLEEVALWNMRRKIHCSYVKHCNGFSILTRARLALKMIFVTSSCSPMGSRSILCV